MLATGGFGAVYEAEDLQQRRSVALKLMFLETEGFPVLAARMEREGQLGRHLSHPNLVRAFDHGSTEEGCPFVVTELIPGRTLRDLMREGPLPAARALQIARQLFEAIRACHELGVIHRDLKPRNVMVDDASHDHLTVIDFGLAKLPPRLLDPVGHIDADIADDLSPYKKLTEDGVVFGTLAYMAPETSQGMDAVDARSDLYAAGVMLYELLTGKHPFDVTDPAELFHHHRSVPPPPFAKRAPEVVVPVALEALVMRLLQKSQSDRYGSAAEVLASLTLMDRPLAPARRASTTWQNLLERLRPRSRVAVTLVIAIVTLALLRALTSS